VNCVKGDGHVIWYRHYFEVIVDLSLADAVPGLNMRDPKVSTATPCNVTAPYNEKIYILTWLSD